MGKEGEYHDPKKMNFLQMWYYKYRVNTVGVAMTPAEEAVVTAIYLICFGLFLRYSYIFLAQIVHFVL